MKYICLQENLKRALFVVGNVSNKNINLPILNNILISAKENNIKLVSTNLEIGVTCQLRGKIETDGETTVDSKIISEYVNLLPEQKLIFKSNNDNIDIECDNYKTKIKGESSKEFPLIPVISKDKFSEFNILELYKSLNNVIFATATNENRIELSGVLFNFNKEYLSLVATDSYRLAEKKIKGKKNDLENLKVIVPSRTVQELLRIISSLNSYKEINESSTIKIYVSDNQVLFSFNSIEIISRLINGEYPDYEKIIPKNFKTEVRVNRLDLLRAVKASSVFSKSGINDISLIFKKDIINIYSSSGHSGESSVNLSAKINGEDNDITMNYRYLVDALNNVDAGEIELKLLDNASPCLIRSDNDNNYIYIIMPIKT